MDNIYYKPNALWKGKTAIKKLHEITGKEINEILKWFGEAVLLANSQTSTKNDSQTTL